MLPVEIKNNIYWIGVNDHTSGLFEGLWPIMQEGVSYNAYLINDQKKAVIDLATAGTTGDILDQIKEITDISSLDYVIVNHMEPDHSGALHTLRQLAPKVKIVGTEKTRRMLEAFYGISDGVQVVGDGDTLSLGSHTLQFLGTPNVHWPETMMTYAIGEKILFSCDAFGSYGSLHGALFDGDCPDLDYYEKEALRYYSNIVATYSNPVTSAIGKLSSLAVDIVAPSHGLVWRKNPRRIIDLYQQWAAYGSNPAEAGVTLMYGSMYRNTERMMGAVAQGIAGEGLPLSVFDVAHTHVSYILPSLWLKRGLLVGAPTYEGGLFPPMTQALEVVRLKRLRNKTVGYFGSYGWGGGGRRHFQSFAESMKWDWVDALEVNGGPSTKDLEQCKVFGAEFARRIKAG